MFKRLLLPVDPARPFAAANEYAVQLAHKFGSRIFMTYVIDDHLLGPVAEEAHSSIDEALEWVGRDAMQEFADDHPDLDCQKTLAYGNTPTALFQMVLQTGADTCVLGGYHSRANPKVWGSTVVDIIHHNERPTFVVRKPANIPAPGEPIVVPFDGSDRPIAVLPRIIRFAKETGATLDFVNVSKPKNADKARAALEKGAWIANEEGVECQVHVLARSIFATKAKTILTYARGIHSPLIAVSRLGHSSMHTGRSLTVAWLIAHSDLPVWVVRK